MREDQHEQALFEEDVRRICRALWPEATGGNMSIGGRERDAVFFTEEVVHCVEATTSRSRAKAGEDAKKLADLSKRLRQGFKDKLVKCWFITQYELTPDQQAALRSYPGVTTLTFDRFRAKLVDGRGYLEMRDDYQFGSARALGVESYAEPGQYIPSSLTCDDGHEYTIDELVKTICEGRCCVLLGDYGAGKSMTLRQIFRAMEAEFRRDRLPQVPIHLNLRDHHGETDPVEALERHARKIGFSTPNQLVRAWRSGYAAVFLDGFDELSSAGWAGRTRDLVDLRYKAAELIRGFIKDSPDGVGIVVAGRRHYFDSDQELASALGLPAAALRVRLGDFTDDQVKDYLASIGWDEEIPAWLPARPLLLGELAVKGLLGEVVTLGGCDPATGWDLLLDRVCAREAAIIEAGIDGGTLRRIMERLATNCRRTHDGLAPFGFDTTEDCFRAVVGWAPDDRGMQLLQRLPGLTNAATADGFRQFADESFAEAARAGDVFHFIADPFNIGLSRVSEWRSGLGELGSQVASLRCQHSEHTAKQLSAALACAARSGDQHNVVPDIQSVMDELRYRYTDAPTTVREVVFQCVVCRECGVDFSNLTVRDGVVEHLILEPGCDQRYLPAFVDCMIDHVHGAAGVPELQQDRFQNSTVNSFTDVEPNTAQIMGLAMPVPSRIALSILEKVYLQPGHGRKEAALSRGLSHQVRSLVPKVLDLLRREGLLVVSRASSEPVWLPVRGQAARVQQMLAEPSTNTDPVLASASAMK